MKLPSHPLFNPYFELFQTLQTTDHTLQLKIRKKLIWAFSWAIPSPEVIEAICFYSPLVELGAGTGYWAWLLEQKGAEVVAYESEPRQPPHWHSILKGSPEIVSQYSQHTLFLCWPPYDLPMAEQALRFYSGNFLIYIGEWLGRTANSNFHQMLEKEWALEQTLPLPNWPGFSDQVYFFRRSSFAEGQFESQF